MNRIIHEIFEQAGGDWMANALRRFAVANSPAVRAQMDLERRAGEIYRAAAGELGQRISATDPKEWEKVSQLRALRRRSTSLLRTSSAEMERLVRSAWREATRENLARIERFNRSMGDISGARFGALDSEDAQAMVRSVVRYMQDPINADAPLSDRVWGISSRAPREILRQTQLGLLLGENGQQIGQRVQQYLADPKGTSRQMGTIRALRTKARKARAEGDTKRAKRLFASARERQAALPAGQGPGVYRSPARNAMRLVRGEFKRAERQAAVQYAKARPWVGGIRWVLSRAHPEPDVCDGLVGVYTPETLPDVPHPNDLCSFLLVPKRRMKAENVQFSEPSKEFVALPA